MKYYLLLLLAFILTINCTQEKEYLIAQNESKDRIFGGKETLILKKDSSFTFTYIPNDKNIGKDHFISGNYKLKNDTIYLKSKKLSTKVIVVGDEIELLALNAKIKIVKNNLSIKNTCPFKIPQDFTVFTYNESLKYYFENPVKATKISLNDFENLESVIQKQIDLNIARFKKHKSQSDYFKQCIFVINANNEKEVWLQGISKKSSFNEPWKNQITSVDDGGEYYFLLKMNLTTGKIYYFSPHGSA